MVPELSKTVTFKLSTRAIRTIDKLGGISQAIMKAKEEKHPGLKQPGEEAAQRTRRIGCGST